MSKRGTIHIDAALTNYAVNYRNENFIADKVLPVIPVAKQSDKYFIFGKEAFQLYDDKRANGKESKEVVSWTVSNDNFFCDVHALSDLVSDEDRNNADAPIMPDMLTTDRLMQMIMLRREYSTASKLFNATTFAGYTTPLTGTDRWDDFANSDPIGDIEDAKGKVQGAVGFEANSMIIGVNVYRKLIQHPDLIARVKYVQKGVLTLADLKLLFQVENIYVGSALYRSTKEGQTETLSKVWGKMALVYYQPKSTPDLKVPNIGFIPTWKIYGNKTALVEKYRINTRHGDLVDVQAAYDVVISLAASGYLYTTVVA